MRRKDREISKINELLDIMGECRVCRIATQDEEGLYIVPLNFGYQYDSGHLVLYFHSAKEGRKVNAFQKSPQAAFEMDCGHRLVEGKAACEYGYAYKSIIGNGRISLVEDTGEKKQALSLLMKQQTGKEFAFDDAAAESVFVFRLDVQSFTGKQKDSNPHRA